MAETFGQKASLTKEATADESPHPGIARWAASRDPFVMKDVFQRAQIAVNETYFEISPELWNEIEGFIRQRLEPSVSAGFPDAMASNEKARRLVEKIWEASDVTELAPLIEAFRLPPDQALDIFKAWKGINFYSFQYARVQPRLIDMDEVAEQHRHTLGRHVERAARQAHRHYGRGARAAGLRMADGRDRSARVHRRLRQDVSSTMTARCSSWDS
jgi:hypothetical protein